MIVLNLYETFADLGKSLFKMAPALQILGAPLLGTSRKRLSKGPSYHWTNLSFLLHLSKMLLFLSNIFMRNDACTASSTSYS